MLTFHKGREQSARHGTSGVRLVGLVPQHDAECTPVAQVGGRGGVDITGWEDILNQARGAEGVSHCGKARTPDWDSLCHWGHAERQVGMTLDQDRPQQPHCQGSGSKGRGAGCTCGASQSRTMSPRCSQGQMRVYEAVWNSTSHSGGYCSIQQLGARHPPSCLHEHC